MHAKHPRSTSIVCSTSPPSRTRTQRLLGTSAYHTAPSSSMQIPSGTPLPRSAHTRRFDSTPSLAMSNAIRFHRDNLPSAPVREPEPILVPARRLTHGEPGDQSPNVGSHHVPPTPIEGRHFVLLTARRATVNYEFTRSILRTTMSSMAVG